MEFLPTNLGTRPGLACEVRPEGIVAARADDGAGLLAAIVRVPLFDGQVTPGLRAGNVADRPGVVAAVRKALESVMLRDRQVTLVLPDAAVRVLLLDFDALPGKQAEALPVVRFRLKKLLPFDAEDAVVSFQTMSSTKGLIRVLAVAVPRDVLQEYEGLIREAGFEPGAVLPSTLAALGGVEETEDPVLVVNAGRTSVTTAIVRGNVVLLHRSLDMQLDMQLDRQLDTQLDPATPDPRLPQEVPALADHESFFDQRTIPQPPRDSEQRMVFAKAAALSRQENDLASLLANDLADSPTGEVPNQQNAPLVLSATGREVTQAVSVAAAYFEDTLGRSPGVIVSAGPMGADALGDYLAYSGLIDVTLRELVDPAVLLAGASTTTVPRGWMAGVRGALRS